VSASLKVAFAAVCVGLMVASALLARDTNRMREERLEDVRQQLGACLAKKQIYVQCSTIDETHDLCERMKK
jgi:hypothetical protein